MEGVVVHLSLNHPRHAIQFYFGCFIHVHREFPLRIF